MPTRVVKVYHRLNTTAGYKFDGVDYHFGPHETKHMDFEIAQHLHDTSVFKYEPTAGTLQRAIVMEGNEGFEVPYDGDKPMELLDRSVDPEPFVKRGMDDKPRKTEYKTVQGTDQDMKKRAGIGVF